MASSIFAAGLNLCLHTECSNPTGLSLFHPLQAARSGLEQSQQRASSATSEPDKAEALVGVELYEALVKALE